MQAEARERLALALIGVTPALWAVNFVIGRVAPGIAAPHQLALGRWALAGALLVWVARRELWRERHSTLAAWPQYLVLGGCGMLVCGAWVYLAAHTTVAMNIALIYSTSPVLIALGAALWLGERLRLRQWLGVPLALAGVLHVVVQGRWSALADLRLLPGDGWTVLATLAWAAYALLQKHWPSPLGPTARLAAISVGGALTLLPFALWEIGLPATPAWTTTATGLVLLSALVPGIAAYWIYGWSQRVLGASRVAVTLYLSPLYAGLAAWMVLGEPLGWHHLVGAALILPGVYLVTRRGPG